CHVHPLKQSFYMVIVEKSKNILLIGCIIKFIPDFVVKIISVNKGSVYEFVSHFPRYIFIFVDEIIVEASLMLAMFKIKRCPEDSAISSHQLVRTFPRKDHCDLFL